MADAEFLARVHARAARQAQEGGAPPPGFVPPGPPVPETPCAEPALPDPGPPVVLGPRLPQKQRTRLLFEALVEAASRHAESPETILMALELFRHHVLAVRVRQSEME